MNRSGFVGGSPGSLGISSLCAASGSSLLPGRGRATRSRRLVAAAPCAASRRYSRMASSRRSYTPVVLEEGGDAMNTPTGRIAADVVLHALRHPRGRYAADRAAQLSGIPRSTLYDWQRADVYVPDFAGGSPMAWSYRDLVFVRVLAWLRNDIKT